MKKKTFICWVPRSMRVDDVLFFADFTELGDFDARLRVSHEVYATRGIISQWSQIKSWPPKKIRITVEEI